MSDLNKMLLVNSNTIETYKYNVTYMIDIVTNNEEQLYEAWIYYPNSGMKDYIIGMPMHQQSKEKFIEYVEFDIKNSARLLDERLDDLEEAFWKRMDDEKEMYRRILASEDKNKTEGDDLDEQCEGLDDADDCKTCERYSKSFKQS